MFFHIKKARQQPNPAHGIKTTMQKISSFTQSLIGKPLLLLALCTLIGCGKESSLPYADVSGIVLLDEQPVTSGYVQFIPLPGQETTGPRVSGVIEPDGSFNLIGPGGYEGAPVGMYVVTFHTLAPPPPGSSLDGKSVEPISIEKPTQQIPELYAAEQTSGQTVEIKPDGNELTFKLSSRVQNLQFSQTSNTRRGY